MCSRVQNSWSNFIPLKMSLRDGLLTYTFMKFLVFMLFIILPKFSFHSIPVSNEIVRTSVIFTTAHLVPLKTHLLTHHTVCPELIFLFQFPPYILIRHTGADLCQSQFKLVLTFSVGLLGSGSNKIMLC